MITVQIASDLHIEHNRNDIPNISDYIIPVSEVLILAGDIGSLYKLDQLRGFLERLSNLFQAILYIPGNHEFYMRRGYQPISYKALETRLESLGNSISNLYILNRRSVRINDVCIAGCTLWSNPKCTVPPFIVRVNGFNTAAYSKQHKKDLKYIKKMISYCKKEKCKLVVVTHHPPSYRALDGAKKRKRFESLYASNLDHLLNGDDVKVWICGHTHKNIDFLTNNGCRVVTNQKGKVKDRVKDYVKSLKILL